MVEWGDRRKGYLMSFSKIDSAVDVHLGSFLGQLSKAVTISSLILIYSLFSLLPPTPPLSWLKNHPHLYSPLFTTRYLMNISFLLNSTLFF